MKKKSIKLSTDDRLAMFRNAMYTKMGVTNEHRKKKIPTDRQCMEWFQRVCCQAELRATPDIVMDSTTSAPVKMPSIAEPFTIKTYTPRVLLPEWRDLPK